MDKQSHEDDMRALSWDIVREAVLSVLCGICLDILLLPLGVFGFKVDLGVIYLESYLTGMIYAIFQKTKHVPRFLWLLAITFYLYWRDYGATYGLICGLKSGTITLMVVSLTLTAHAGWLSVWMLNRSKLKMSR